MIISDTAEIRVNASNKKKYASLFDYDIKIGSVILVPIIHLSKSAEVTVVCKCNLCGIERIMKIRVSRYSGNCRACTNKTLAIGSVRTEEYKQNLKERQLGELNHNYNPKLTDEDRENRHSSPKHHKWAKLVKVRDNYTCMHCNARGGNLNSHHIEAFSSNKESRYDVDNGITLCATCHNTFHNVYGRKGDTTQEQLTEYLKTNGK